MKTFAFIFIGLLGFVSSLANAKNVTLKGSYVLAGECESEIWVSDGHGDGHWNTTYIQSKNDMPRDISNISINSGASILVSSGLTTDGFGGCALFKSLIDCTSNKGTFQADDGVSPGPFHSPAMVLSFTCDKN